MKLSVPQVIPPMIPLKRDVRRCSGSFGMLSTLAAIDKEVFEPLCLTAPDTLDPPWDSTDYGDAIHRQWQVFVSMTEDGFQACGFIVTGLTPGRTLVIERWGVLFGRRHQGHGRALLLHAVHHAIDCRALEISIRVPDETEDICKSMEAARNVLRSCDFKFRAEERGKVEFVRRFI